uniref:Uncharacterized protein n=1 Tax=Hyaloperonospora arabidopsidis (strain Emoy2) TaxID=559515 RepID=M4BBZ0_HYAAE
MSGCSLQAACWLVAPERTRSRAEVRCANGLKRAADRRFVRSSSAYRPLLEIHRSQLRRGDQKNILYNTNEGQRSLKSSGAHTPKVSIALASLDPALFFAPALRVILMAGKDATEAHDGADIAMHQQLQVDSMASTSSTRSGGATSCSTTSSTVQNASTDRRRLKRPHSRTLSIDHDSVASSHQKTKKRLRWSTITVHEFGVGLGGSSVPGKGGPSIGLGDKPEFTWTTEVGQMAERVEGVHRFTPKERVQLLQSAGVSEGMILRFSREANIINCSRRRTLVEDIAERKEAKRRQQQAPPSSCPCVSPFLHRPHMIPVDYV